MNQHMRNVTAETHMSPKYGSRMPTNRRTILNVEVITTLPIASLLSKIGRLSLVNIELTPQYQPIPGARVRGS